MNAKLFVIFYWCERFFVNLCCKPIITMTYILMMDNSEKGFYRLNEDWSQFYNPLER
jgi:hypothetical protein